MKVRENKEDLYVSLSKESKHELSLIHTRYKKNNQENANTPHRCYHIQEIKDVLHKNIITS